MTLNSLKVPAVSTPTPQPKPAIKLAVAMPVKAMVRPMLPKAAVAGDERRRGQRVLLRVRANIHVAVHGKPATLEAVTLSVNTRGALIVLAQSLPVETRLVLEHGMTKERVACRVSRAAKEMPEGFQVPLEFDSPEPDFWKIAFPPADWRPLDES